MSEPIEWVYQAGTGCAYCKDGLCQRMNQLMEDGHSQRAASRIMEEEASGKWKAESIRSLFINWTGVNLHQKSDNKTLGPNLGQNKEPQNQKEVEESEEKVTGQFKQTESEPAGKSEAALPEDVKVNFKNLNYDLATMYARSAIMQLGRIESHYTDREEAFDLVIEWIEKNR